MTAPSTLDLEQAPVPVEGIPNHRASSGESGAGREGSKRPGIFSAGNKSGRSPAKKSVPALPSNAKDKLAEMYVMAGMGVMAFDPVLSGVIMEQAEQCAQAVCDLAKENDTVRRVVLMLTTGGAFAALLAAHLPILLTLAARHAPNEGVANIGTNGMMMLYKTDVHPDKEADPSGVGTDAA